HHPRHNLRRPEFFPGWLLLYVRGQPLYLSSQIRWYYINDLYLEKENFLLPLLYEFLVVVIIFLLREINHLICLFLIFIFFYYISFFFFFITYFYCIFL